MSLRLLLRCVFIAAFFTMGRASTAAEPAPPAAPLLTALPEEWDGVWQGAIEVLVGGQVRHATTMELRVAKSGDGAAKSWTIHYGGQTPRLYEIRPAGSAAGRFIVDEKNGILLEEQLVGRVLHSVFSVGDVLLTSRFENRGEEISVEIATFAFDLALRREAAGAPAPATSFPFRSIQRGILRRQQN